MEQTVSYDCPSCGEPIEVWVDLSAGREQSSTEDCPVCCNPNVLFVEVDREGNARIEARSE